MKKKRFVVIEVVREVCQDAAEFSDVKNVGQLFLEKQENFLNN